MGTSDGVNREPDSQVPTHVVWGMAMAQKEPAYYVYMVHLAAGDKLLPPSGHTQATLPFLSSTERRCPAVGVGGGPSRDDRVA